MTGPGYRVWPRFAPESVHVSDPRQSRIAIVGVFLVAAVFWIPSVGRATGIPAPWATAVILPFALWLFICQRFFLPRARREPAVFHFLLVTQIALGISICIGILVLGKDPKTPLWALLCVYAAFNGAMHELDASFGFLAVHAGSPLVAIPVFLARGADPSWSIAGPAIGSGLSVMAYHFMAMRSEVTRTALRERDEERGRRRALEQESERRQIARDLHDSVGSALSLFGLCGDLIERNRADPAELDRIAGTLRESARDGLGELRGVLDAMAPVSSDLAGVGANLRRVAARLSAASGALVEIQSEGGDGVLVEGPARIALVRVFQEAASNALRHGRAQNVRGSLASERDTVVLTVVDDGAGFDPAATSQGRGLPNMRTRALELGGTFAIESAAGAGARVTLRLPLQKQ